MANTALNRTGQFLGTNKSGGNLNYGDVVVLDNTNNNGFTTTTTAALSTRGIGVIIEPNGIANNATGMVASAGWVPKVNLNTAATNGQFLTTHTVAGQATPHSSPQVEGDFAVVLDITSASSPTAWLFGSPNGPSGGGAGTVTTTGSPASGNLTQFSGATSITNGDLSGDVTTSGTLATTIGANKVTTTTINNSAVTLAKIANATTNSVLVGSGAAGSGAAYSEIALGTNLSMSGTTLNASGGGGSITQGTFASLPATCAVGDLYFFTDSVYNVARCSSTNVWSLFLDGKLAASPTPSAGWTLVNAGGKLTVSDVSGTMLVSLANDASLNWRIATKTQPSTPYTITVKILAQQLLLNSITSGLYFYDGTKLMGIEVLTQTSVQQLRVEKITNVTTDNSTVYSKDLINTAGGQYGASFDYSTGMWYRLGNDGSTLSFSYSFDGVNWITVFSEAIGTFITPTHYGIGGVNVTSTSNTSLQAVHSVLET